MIDPRRVLVTSGVLVATILIFILLFNRQILLSIGNYLIIQDQLHPAEVIHVIAGDDYRTEFAIQLYLQGYAQHIFFTGGWCKKHGYDHGQHGMQLALARGVPQEAIAYDDTPVMSTYDETMLLKDYLDESPDLDRSVIVVSDPFHMRRAHWTYRRVLGQGTEIIMAPVTFEQTPYQQQWWKDEQSKRYVKEEYQKFVYYIARYQLSWGPLKEWLASLDKE